MKNMKFNRRLQKAALAIVAALLLQSLLAGAGAHSASSASVESDSNMDSIASLEPASTGTETLPALRGDEAISYLKEQQLYPSLSEAMTAARYRIRASESSSPSPRSALSAASYYANNPAQQMTALFTSDGIRLRSKAEDERSKPSRGWQFAMRLRQIGYGDNLLSVAAGAMQVNDNRIEIARRVESRESGVESQIAQRSDSRLQTPDSGLLEWYENRAEGIEQGFRIDAAPGYRREGERLRLRLAVEGELRARGADEGQAVDLVTRAGERALRYDHLKVWDAEGKDLPASMRVEGKSVWLEVEDQGAVYPVTIDPTFSQQAKLTASDGAALDQFGQSVAISGETAIVGAAGDDVGANSFQGSAYVFVRVGATWSEQQKLTASDGAGGDLFGISVAMSGETAIVGAHLANNVQGSAYVFVRAGTVWSEQQKLTASDGAAVDTFGISVAISGETIIVGAFLDDVGANTDQGSAYVFVRVGTTWSQQQQLMASDGANGDRFGTSVAISGETVIVGAVLDDVGANADQGSVYFFINECLPNTPPSISTSPVSVLRCNSLTGATIATVSDVEDAASALVVTVVSGGSASGITLSNISNLNGSITATVAASPTATSGTVRLRVTDLGGSTSEADLQVTVLSPPPVINCQANVTAVAPPSCNQTAGAIINYPLPAASDGCGSITPVCSPPSGSSFPVGTTTVTCTATGAGGTATCSFAVTVFGACLQDDSNSGNVALFNIATGEYRFCCGGVIIASGIGTVSKKGCEITITHNATDRRVMIKTSFAKMSGNASIQSPPGVIRCTITDRNILDNSCQCN